MEYFWKCVALSLVAVVLAGALRQQKDMAVLLGMLACALVLMGALRLLDPVLALFEELETMGGLDPGSMTILFKAAGIGLTAEISGSVCADSGNGALSKALRLLGTAAMLYVTLPMLEKLMDLVQEMVGAS